MSNPRPIEMNIKMSKNFHDKNYIPCMKKTLIALNKKHKFTSYNMTIVCDVNDDGVELDSYKIYTVKLDSLKDAIKWIDGVNACIN
jgi:hypothetical protein